MRVPGLALALTSAIMLAGCGASDADQVHATLNQFAQAVAAKNSKPICEHVLAPGLVARLEGVGLSCEYAISRFFFSCNVRKPTLTVGRVSFNRGRATALVYAGAKGQTPGIFQLGLLKTSQGWRVATESSEKRAGGSC